MNVTFLFFANLTLLLRLRWLLVDRPPGAAAWWSKAAIEALAVILFLVPGVATAGAIATSIVLNAAAILCDRRASDRNAGHLVIGGLHLVTLSIWFGPALGANFRPGLAMMLARVEDWSAVGTLFSQAFTPRTMIVTLGLLLAANEANLLIRWLLGRLQLRPLATAGAGLDANEFARGRVIGLLERTLIYFFVLNLQYGAVGFILAAKGFTRFKDLDQRPFAEYVLIGTLLSSGLAMLIAAGVRNLG